MKWEHYGVHTLAETLIQQTKEKEAVSVLHEGIRKTKAEFLEIFLEQVLNKSHRSEQKVKRRVGIVEKTSHRFIQLSTALILRRSPDAP
jgi:hypothetical protein